MHEMIVNYNGLYPRSGGARICYYQGLHVFLRGLEQTLLVLSISRVQNTRVMHEFSSIGSLSAALWPEPRTISIPPPSLGARQSAQGKVEVAQYCTTVVAVH